MIDSLSGVAASVSMSASDAIVARRIEKRARARVPVNKYQHRTFAVMHRDNRILY